MGALASPLVATQFSELKRWNFHYLTSLGLGAINLLLVVYYYRFKPIEKLFSDVGYIEATVEEPIAVPTETASQSGTERERRHIDLEQIDVDTTVVAAPKPSGSANKMGRIVRDPVVLLVCLWAFIYVGTEVTIGGWIVTFLREVRGAGPSAGYVSSGFFGGLTVGRVLHVPVARLAPERYILFVYGALAVGLQVVSRCPESYRDDDTAHTPTQVVWTVKDIVGDAVAISFVGLLIGPFYPIIMNVLVAVLPVDVTGGAIGKCISANRAPDRTNTIADNTTSRRPCCCRRADGFGSIPVGRCKLLSSRSDGITWILMSSVFAYSERDL